MALYPEDQEWRDIAKQVSIEMDPAKLTILVGELCRALDERNERKPQALYPFPADSPKSQGNKWVVRYINRRANLISY
jgi:hypothetical protein